MTPTLLQEYKEKVMPALQQQFGYTNVHQIPKLDKIVVNTCVGKSVPFRFRPNTSSNPVGSRSKKLFVPAAGVSPG